MVPARKLYHIIVLQYDYNIYITTQQYRPKALHSTNVSLGFRFLIIMCQIYWQQCILHWIIPVIQRMAALTYESFVDKTHFWCKSKNLVLVSMMILRSSIYEYLYLTRNIQIRALTHYNEHLEYKENMNTSQNDI